MAALLFVLGHAAVHAVMWALPFTDAIEDMPFDPAHSWWLVGIALSAGLAFYGFQARV